MKAATKSPGSGSRQGGTCEEAQSDAKGRRTDPEIMKMGYAARFRKPPLVWRHAPVISNTRNVRSTTTSGENPQRAAAVRAERRFDRRLLEERYSNPPFGVSNRPHQDR